MKKCPFSTIFKSASQHSLENFCLQEVARIYVHNLAASFPATLRRCEDQQQEVLSEFPLFPNIRLHQVSLKLWNLWTVSSLHRSAAVDVDLIYRNNRAKNQFNGFFTTVEVNRLLSLFFAS